MGGTSFLRLSGRLLNSVFKEMRSMAQLGGAASLNFVGSSVGIGYTNPSRSPVTVHTTIAVR
jgi:hypothetical protein